MSHASLSTMDVQTLYQDEHLLVLDKPAGLLSVPGRGADKQDCLSARAQRLWPDALVVHRLDMATSGLLLMARSPAVQRVLGNAFADRQVRKRYEAVVTGRLAAPQDDAGPHDAGLHDAGLHDAGPHDAGLHDPGLHHARLPSSPGEEPAEGGWGVIDLPLALDWPRRPLSIVDRERGKPSRTLWRVLAHDGPQGTTRVELAPVTGRSHQLRVHLQALGHPILGDALYAPAPVQAQAPRLLLHATRLAFAHPVDGRPLDFHSPAPF
jgi:tRNA pseudouridine32 synthase/23S rRNA pseudouridine746 synthase